MTKDKNGKELKNGDIIKWFIKGFSTSGGYPAPNISWQADDEIKVAIIWDTNNIPSFKWSTGIGAVGRQTEIEVIGNIDDGRYYWDVI